MFLVPEILRAFFLSFPEGLCFRGNGTETKKQADLKAKDNMRIFGVNPFFNYKITLE